MAIAIDIAPGVVLTTDSPASHYGIPALRVLDGDGPDLGPADPLRGQYAAEVVHAWATQHDSIESLDNA